MLPVIRTPASETSSCVRSGQSGISSMTSGTMSVKPTTAAVNQKVDDEPRAMGNTAGPGSISIFQPPA